MASVISATGFVVPDQCITNDELVESYEVLGRCAAAHHGLTALITCCEISGDNRPLPGSVIRQMYLSMKVIH